jgi:DNA-binding response OmpR family regulator
MASVVIEWLSRNRPGLPLLVMSGYTEDEQLLRGLRSGELPFLRKPFSSKELLSTIRKLLSSE